MRLKSITVFMLALLAAAASAAERGGGFSDRLAFVGEAGLSGIFEGVAVKADRPMPWRTFVLSRYNLFKGRGDVRDGDLGADADAAIWLAILDPEYRRAGRLIYVAGGEVPGVADDGWLSLREFEGVVMPRVVRDAASFGGGDVERAVREVVGRAAALHRLSWYDLLVIPGSDVAGWRPLKEEDPLQRPVRELSAAYDKRDAAAMRIAARDLAVALKRQPGYPPPVKLSLESYLDRFAVIKVGLGLCAASALLFVLWAATGKRGAAQGGVWTALGAFVVMTAALAARSIIAGHLPVAGTYELLLFFSWSVVLFFLVFYFAKWGESLGLVLMPAAAALGAAAYLFPSAVETQLAPALRSPWFAASAVLASFGEGAFAVGFAAAIFRLFRPRRPLPRFPSGGELAVAEYRAMTLGYMLFAAGALLAGAIWAQQVRAAWWNWTHGDAAWLVVFAIATAYLHAGRARGKRGNGVAALAILTFVAAAGALFAGAIFSGATSSVF